MPTGPDRSPDRHFGISTRNPRATGPRAQVGSIRGALAARVLQGAASSSMNPKSLMFEALTEAQLDRLSDPRDEGERLRCPPGRRTAVPLSVLFGLLLAG